MLPPIEQTLSVLSVLSRAQHHVLPSLVVASPTGTTGQVSLTPSAGGLPGSGPIKQVADGIAWWALLLSLLGLVIGAASWALGSHSNNYQYASTGRKAVIVSGLAALLIGAAPALINFFFGVGTQVHG